MTLRLFNKALYDVSTKKCARLAWHERRSLVPYTKLSQFDLFLMKEGRRFEDNVVEKVFGWGNKERLVTSTTRPEGTMEVTMVDVVKAAEETKRLMEVGSDVTTIIQPTFVHDDFIARGDVIRRVDGGGWEIIEIKSSLDKSYRKKVPDLAFTTYVASLMQPEDDPIVSSTLVCVNSSYKSPSVSTLHTTQDLTEEVSDELSQMMDPESPASVQALQSLTASPTPPPASPQIHCGKCPMFSTCVGSSSPSHPIWEFQRLNQAKLESLVESAPSLEVSDCDPEALTASQQKFWTAVNTNEPVVERRKLEKALSSLTPPMYYLDFEAVGMLDPPYGGMSPYETYVTQYSLHKSVGLFNVRNDDLEHYEFLADPRRDCREDLLVSLLQDLSKEGPIVVYSPYEKTQLKKLAALFPQHADDVIGVMDRLFDMEKLIRETVVLPSFRGKSSIKVTLPSLCPSFSSSYTNLAEKTGLADGGAANGAMTEMIRKEISGELAERTKEALLEYCKLDTLAMVEIHRALLGLLTDKVDDTVEELTKNKSQAGDPEMTTNLQKLTVVQLQDRLRRANLPVSGRKAELVERLQEHT